MEKKLNGQVAIITGGSSGIGTGCVIALADAGATVVINYSSAKSKERADAVLEKITSSGGKGITYQCDVSKEDEVMGMFKETINLFGTVDILINNAGLQRDAKFVDMTLEDWNFVLSVNLTGQFLCAREAIREFLRRGNNGKSKSLGKIICMSSVHEVIPWAGHVNYAASKGGIMMLMKSIAQEYASQKVRVNSIAPGAIATAINKENWDTDKEMQKLLKLVPYKRIGQPDDVGRAAVWLASDDSEYVNGSTLFIDGGMLLYPGFEDNG